MNKKIVLVLLVLGVVVLSGCSQKPDEVPKSPLTKHMGPSGEFSISYPSNFIRNKLKESDLMLVWFDGPSLQKGLVRVKPTFFVAKDNKKSLTLKEIRDQTLDESNVILDEGEGKLNNFETMSTILTFTGEIMVEGLEEPIPVPFKAFQFLLSDPQSDNFYQIQYTFTEADFDTYLPLIEDATETFTVS